MSDPNTKSQLREALMPVFTEKIPNDSRVSKLFEPITSDESRRDRHVTALADALGALAGGAEVDYGALVNLHRDAPVTPPQYEAVISHIVAGLGDYDSLNDTLLQAEVVQAYAPVSVQIEDAVVNGAVPDNYQASA